MAFYLKFLLSLLGMIILGLGQLDAQVYLQLERFNNPESKKIHMGESLEFRLKEFPDTWKKFEIIDLSADQQLVIMEDQYYNVSDFKDLRFRHPGVKSLGLRLMQFSGVWFIYGGVASLVDDEFSIGGPEITVGLSAALVGLVMNKIFDKTRVKLSNRQRLRVIDTRFTLDAY